MDFLLFASALLKLIYAIAAVAAWWITVRLVNRSTDTDVRAAQGIIDQNPLALGIYRAGLLIAIAIVIAHAIG